MPRDIQSIPITFANTGIVLKSSSDEIPITAYKALVNVQTDRENTISVRKGFQRLNEGLPTAPYGIYFLKDANGRQWRYAVANRGLYIAPVTDPNDATVWPIAWDNDFAIVPGGFGFSGGLSSEADPRPIWTSYTLIGQEMKPYVFMADKKEFLKHPGGQANATRVGIPKPRPLNNVVNKANDTVYIEEFQDVLLWTADNSTIAQVDPSEFGKGLSIKINGDGAVGGAWKAITSGGYPVILNLDITAPDNVIEIWYKFASAESALNCAEITISFGLATVGGTTDFETTFQKAIIPSSFEGASQVGSSGRVDAWGDKVTNANDLLDYRNSKNLNPENGLFEYTDPYYDTRPEDYYDPSAQFNAGQVVQARPGFGVWNALRIKKSEFTRVGESALTNPNLNWDKVTAIRIDIKNVDTTTGAGDCEVQFDDFTYLQTGKLFGVDYQWTYTYYNSLTNTESDYADPVQVPYPGAEYSQFTLEIPVCPLTTPPMANPDKIRIYRIGGTANIYKRVAEIAYTPGVEPPDYVDNVGDLFLGAALETDNQLPVDKPSGVILYDDRLFTWGGQQTLASGAIVKEPGNRLRFSKAVRVESFPADNYVYVGSGSENIQNCLEHDGELFIFTLTKVYRLVGSNGVYRAVGTAVNQGLRVPRGLCKGARAVYMYSYDGIYEFPSGRKISEPINQVFKNETVNEIPPLAVGREQEVSLAFWDSKLYISYCTTTDPTITNDAMLVFDTIYERWHWYMYGAQEMFVEPDTNIFVGGNLVQWDHILDGVPSDFHYSGPWPMSLETGYADQCQEGNRGIFWAVDTRDFDLGMPDQEKRIFDYVIDADTQGTAVLLQVAYDNAFPDTQGVGPGYDSIGPVNTVGRQRVILPTPLGVGESVLAVRSALRILSTTSPTATSTTRLFKIIHRILPEPMRHRTFVTDWSDYGVSGPKYFRELWVDVDSFGTALERIELHVDQAVAQIISPVPATTGQTKLYFGLSPDIRGSLGRLKFVTSGENEVKLYDHNIVTIAEPPQINTIQTPWSDEGWPYNKLWKEVLLDIDTNGIPMDFSFWLDGAVKESFSVTTQNGRQRITHSLEKDLFGKLGRVTLSESYFDPVCCLPQGIRFYGVSYVIDKEPADVTFSDSYDQLFSFDRLKVLRRLWISMKNPDDYVTMNIYADETLVATKTIAANSMSTGFSIRRIDLEGGIKGRLFRIQFTSVFPFQLYWERSDWELKNLNTEDGYRRERMVPPQTF